MNEDLKARLRAAALPLYLAGVRDLLFEGVPKAFVASIEADAPPLFTVRRDLARLAEEHLRSRQPDPLQIWLGNALELTRDLARPVDVFEEALAAVREQAGLAARLAVPGTLDGLLAAAEPLADWTGGELLAAYVRSAPVGWQNAFHAKLGRPPADLLHEMAWRLQDLDAEANLLLAFGLQLADLAGAAERHDQGRALRAWCDDLRRCGASLPPGAQPPDAPGPSRWLVLRVAPDGPGPPWRVQAWLVDAPDAQVPWSLARHDQLIHDAEAADLDALRAHLDDALDAAYERDVVGSGFAIHLVLPLALIEVPADCWCPADGPRLGRSHLVVVRSYERIYLRDRPWRRANAEWQRLCARERPPGSLARLPGDELPDPDEYARQLNLCPHAAFESPPGRARVEALLRAGAPIVLWPREACCARLDAVLSAADTVAAVHACRGEAPKAIPGHTGHHLSLLWDERDQQPADALLPLQPLS